MPVREGRRASSRGAQTTTTPHLASPLSCESGICHLSLGLIECLVIPSLP